MPTVHIIGNVVLMGLFVGLGLLLARRRETAIAGIVLSGAVAFISLIIAVWPGLIVAIVPYRDLTFYDNLYPLAGALFFPCVWWFVKSPMQRARMIVLCSVLLVLSFQPYAYHFAPLEKSGGTFIDDDGVCRQTSDYNCSAAAIVTLLNAYGIRCTEARAIELAQTRSGKGTECLGLYRALRHFADQDNDLRAVVRHDAMDDLLHYDRPAIILVGLPGRGHAPNAAAYGRQNHWTPGFYHDVVYLGLDPDDPNRVLIADPDMGIERWPISDLRFLYRGQAVMIERDY